jgi:hypothetical protein
MKAFVLIVLFSVTAILTAFGQVDSVNGAPKVRYANSFSFGTLLGKDGDVSTFSFETIHGVRFKKVFVGLGVGYDTYTEWTVVPMIATVSFDVWTRRSNAVFIRFSGARVYADDVLRDDSGFVYSFQNGSMLYPSVGYKLSTNKCNVYFSAGYKMQTINYRQGYRWWWGGTETDIKREIQRITLSLGIGFH